jgi:hypothetical protein
MGLKSRPKKGRKYDGSKLVVDNNEIKTAINEPMNIPQTIEDFPGPQLSPRPTPSVTPSFTPTPSTTPPNTPTRTSTRTQTPTPSITPSNTATKTPTGTPNETPIATRTPTPTPPPTKSNTPTASITPSNSNTPSNTRTPSNTPSNTRTPDRSSDPTPTPTTTPSITPSNTPTPSITPSNTPTNTPTKSETPTQTQTNTQTKTNTPTPEGTQTNTPTPTLTKTPSQTPSNTATPRGSQSPTRTETPTKTPDPSQSRTPRASSSNTPTRTPDGTPRATLPSTALCQNRFIPPEIYKGVTSRYGVFGNGGIVTEFLGQSILGPECNSSIPNNEANQILAGLPNPDNGQTQFTLEFGFDQPINDIVIVIIGTGPGLDETFTFTTNAGVPTISSSTNCYTTINGNEIASGLNAPLDPRAGGGGIFTITGPDCFTILTINGSGGQSGSLISICDYTVCIPPTPSQTPSNTPTSPLCDCYRIENRDWKRSPAVQLPFYYLDCKGKRVNDLTGTQPDPGGSGEITGVRYTYVCGTEPVVNDSRGIVTLLGSCRDGNPCPNEEPPPSDLTVVCNSTNVSTYQGNDGSVNLTITNGLPPYFVYYNNSDITLPLNSLTAGTYPFEVVDSSLNSVYINCTITEPPCAPPGGLQNLNITTRWWDGPAQTGNQYNIGYLNYNESCGFYNLYSSTITYSQLSQNLLITSFVVGATIYNSPASICSCNQLNSSTFWVNLVDETQQVNQTDGIYWVSADTKTCQITAISACTSPPPTPELCVDCSMSGISFSDGLSSCPDIPVEFTIKYDSVTKTVEFDVSSIFYNIYNTNGEFIIQTSRSGPVIVGASEFQPSGVIKIEPEGYPIGSCATCFTLQGVKTTCP